MTIVTGALLALAAISAGACVSILIFLALKRKKAAVSEQSRITGENAGKRNKEKKSFKAFAEKLSENPRSKESVQIRIYAGAVFFALILIFTLKVIFAILVGIAIFYGIGWYYGKKLVKRDALFDSQLIEALGMVTNSVRAGQSLMQALENMVKDTKDPISGEFSSALRQVKLGMSINQALDEICERVKSKDLKIVITSINLARETGGNLGEILSRIADTMRDRRKIQGKINALTAQGRTSGMVMGAVPFLLLFVLYLIEPEMMGLLFSTMIGNIMLAVAVIMISLGMFVINKIVSIDI